MIRFPIEQLLDEQACYDYLLELYHSDGLKCPCGSPLPEDQKPHRYQERPAMVDYKCRFCNKVFNIFTETLWSKSSYRLSVIIMILRGFAQGIPTLHLSEELGLDYKTLLNRRHQIQGNAFDNRNPAPLQDQDVEADEMFQNSGEKGTLHPDPEDPPRPRANKRRGRGTMENDRPPIFGAIGRETGQIRLEVCENTQQATLQTEVEKKLKPL